MMDRLQRVFSISGRVSRLGFWRFQVVQVLASGVVWCLTMFMTMVGGWLGLAPLLLLVPVVVAAIYVGIRRLHDRGRSGWWILPFSVGPYLLVATGRLLAETLGAPGFLIALPLTLGGVALAIWGWLELGFFRGARGANRFGPPPASNRAWLADPVAA
jgi:uncharacterized membrane protein YhaH (DUF805 family)